MKKLFIAMVSMFLLSACSEASTTSMKPPTPIITESTGSTTTDKSTVELSSPTPTSNTIQITGPLTLSRNDLFQYTNKHEYLSVVLISGKYFEDWTPSPFMGRNWVGEFQIQLSNESGEVTSAFDLNGFSNGDIVFNSFFNIEFDDYNGDGNIDFTIGQYASSNGDVFKLFTLDQTGRIKDLPIKGYPDIFVSGTGRYSTKLTKTKLGFSCSYYDNSIGKDVKQSFVWNGKEFVSDK
ncbi:MULTISPECIES: membrane lipoprotein lipid attachment site-containing protein [Paenibacillus]|uniref:Metal-dependent hydrolase n=1 Tax=Paenibacillus naphthalenovorans TaxID=162209 RepID=A0A0U2W8Y4_9BACL|nr:MULTISPECIES: membrane lipoprotein lipid attachment site-containing protein [Paenibacillus]ALS23901.1 metal-dependent hydrolase [Paenibacillus naphthalenovorans]SDI99166.1 hypothetical protein SAMN05421868_11489 [Paenibacillus naphthalenovorans]